MRHREILAHHLARETGYRREWIWRLAKRGEIPGAKWTGKQFRFSVTDELRQWIASKASRHVRRARKKKMGEDWGRGFATFQAIETQWKLLMKQIGDAWREWTPDDVEAIRDYIAPIVEFDRRLRGKGNNLS
jgi:predicted DNA-binding transcriptional regulator AlpA